MFAKSILKIGKEGNNGWCNSRIGIDHGWRDDAINMTGDNYICHLFIFFRQHKKMGIMEKAFSHGVTIIEIIMKTYKYFLIIIIIFILSLLAGCSVLASQMNRPTEEVDATATPITLPTQLSVQTRVESQTCLVAELVAIQTDKPQGDLMAWSPTGHALAFVQPVNQYSGFYIGDLTIYDAATQETLFTSNDKAVFGDLAWSPDGSALAYVSLDQTAGIYTVKTVTLAYGIEVDVFGDEAATDDFASQKGVLSWTNEPDLTLTSVCGADCVRLYQYNIVSQSLNPLQEIRYNENTSLGLVNDLVSLNGYWQISIDNNDNIWITSGGETYTIDQLDNTSLTSKVDSKISLVLADTRLQEIKFSKDSKYLALRTTEQVLIYQLGCTKD
jgi:dipeptidyl aminopeptidase/acylaminoacyl peptidase